jgi:hypothetical protein
LNANLDKRNAEYSLQNDGPSSKASSGSCAIERIQWLVDNFQVEMKALIADFLSYSAKPP